MTDKSAVRYLKEIRAFARKLKFDAKYIDALTMAIKALEEHCINYKVCKIRKQDELLSAISDCED